MALKPKYVLSGLLSSPEGTLTIEPAGDASPVTDFGETVITDRIRAEIAASVQSQTDGLRYESGALFVDLIELSRLP